MRLFRRKRALRTPDNYDEARMAQDHEASTALFWATMPGVSPAVEVDEQMRESEQD